MDNMAFPAKWYGAGKVPPLSILSFFPGEPVHSAALVFCLLRKAFFKSKTGTCTDYGASSGEHRISLGNCLDEWGFGAIARECV